MTSKRMSPSKAMRQLEDHSDHLAERVGRMHPDETRRGGFDLANAAACRIGAEAILAVKGEMEVRHKLYEALEAALSVLERVEHEAEMRADLRREVQVSVSITRKVVGDLGDPEPAVAVR